MLKLSECRYTHSLTGNISDVFQLVLGDATFAQRSELVETMKTFAYSLLEGEPCSVKSVHTHTDTIFKIKT